MDRDQLIVVGIVLMFGLMYARVVYSSKQKWFHAMLVAFLAFIGF